MKYFVYMLENQKSRHYIGITTDLDRRLVEHNNRGAKSTHPFGPWKMIYSEKFDTRSEACKREWHLKNTPGKKEKLEIIQNFSNN